MRLTSVQIKNFRSIKELTVSFEKRCRVLVGINEAGKTNILDALSLLQPDVEPNPDDMRLPAPNEKMIDESDVRFIFSFDRSERLAFYENFANDILVAESSTAIIQHGKVHFSLPQLCDQVWSGLYRVNLLKGTKAPSYWAFPGGRKIIKGWYKPSPTCPVEYEVSHESGTRTLKSLRLIHFQYTDGVPDTYLEKANKNDVHNLIMNAVLAYIGDQLPECIHWHHSDEFLIPARMDLDAFATTPDNCIPLKHAFALADIDDITTAFQTAQKRSNGVRNLLDRVAKRATEHIRDVWPEYKGIALDLRENGANIETSIDDVHNLYDVARRSDGFKRFISFLLMISVPSRTEHLRDVLILIDDPDAGLHPSGQRHLRDELLRISEHNHVVYATHSIFMIDRETIDRHLIVKKTGEVTQAQIVSESNLLDEEVIYNAMGFSTFEILKQKNIIFEGWRDKNLFKTAISRVPRTFSGVKKSFANAGWCHVFGVKDVRRIAPVIELANRECLIVSDSDEPARQYQRTHKKERIFGTWFRYDELDNGFGAVTGEDYLKSDIIIKRVNKLAQELINSKDTFSLSQDTDVLTAVRLWLRPHLTKEACKEFIDRLKEELSANLKRSHIREEYYQMLQALAAKL